MHKIFSYTVYTLKRNWMIFYKNVKYKLLLHLIKIIFIK